MRRVEPIRQRRYRLVDRLLQFAVPLSFLAIMVCSYPILCSFEFDKDEGVNLMKSMLVAQGYPLYQAVWSDQAPLLTLILAGVFRLVGYRVGAARLVVLAFSAALLGGVWRYLRVLGGRACAALGVLLILWLPYYLRLSLSVMVGIPSLALAVLALTALAEWHRRHTWPWLVLSAVTLGLSILTKVFTGFLAPVFMIGILVDGVPRPDGRTPGGGWRGLRLGPVTLWALVFAAAIGGPLLSLPGTFGELGQLWAPHWAARSQAHLAPYTFGAAVCDVRAILWLALPSAGFLLWRRRWLSLYPLAWLAVAALLLSNHLPVWYHHQLLVSVPAAMLAAGAIPELWTWAREGRSHRIDLRRGWTVAASMAVLAFVLVTTEPAVPRLLSGIPARLRDQSPRDIKDNRVVAEMVSYGAQTEWVVTDRPIYAFRAGLPVPPATAAITIKRLATGYLTEEDLLATVRAYRPAQVLLSRFKWPLLREYLQSGYHLVYSHSGENLFVRNDVE